MKLHWMYSFPAFITHQWMVCLLCLVISLPVLANDNSQQLSELLSMDISELMDIKVVLPSRNEERQFDAPAAIYVMTQEDIRRSGFTRIPDLLRMVPGLHVGQLDNNTWAISSRSRLQWLSNSMLVLLDGRTLYNSLFGGVYWDVQDTLIQDIERIEVIRGPGGSLWGANAVDGIINIITKSASKTTDTLLYGGAGKGKQQYEAAIRHGTSFSNSATGRVYAKRFKTDRGEYLDSDESTNDNYFMEGDTANDGGNQNQAGFRVDWSIDDNSALTIQGDVYDAGYDNIRVNQPRDNAVDAKGRNIIVKWSQQKAGSNFELQLYYDFTERFDNLHEEQHHIYDLDFQHSLNFTRHVFTWGLGYRFSSDDIEKTAIGVFALDPEEYSEKLYSAFFQDQIVLETNKLFLTIGSKFERNETTGEEFQPTLRMLWKPDNESSAWASLTRAVRTPTRAELHALLIFCDPSNPGCTQPIGDPDANSEKVVASELGYRSKIGTASTIDIALFDHRYYETDESTGITRTYGWEAVYQRIVSKSWRIETAYAHHKGHQLVNGNETGNNTIPENSLHLRSLYNINQHWEFDTHLYYTEAIEAPTSAPGLKDITRIDLRLGWNPNQSTQTSLSVTNLLNDIHGEAIDQQKVNTATGRGVFLSVNHRFN